MSEYAMSNSWRLITLENDDQHAVPEFDMRKHVASCDCWCEPFERELGIFAHNSLDEREKYEDGIRKPH